MWNSYLVALGEEVQKSDAQQKENTYFIDLPGDLASLRADGTAPVRMLAHVLDLFFMRTSGMFFAWDDPMPGIVSGYRFVARNLGKLFNRARNDV